MPMRTFGGSPRSDMADSACSVSSPACTATNGVVLVCLGVAEVGEDSVAEVLSDVTLVPLDGRGTNALVLGVDVPKLLRVERL
jgi:hypothetical protein